jgi:flagellar motor protein MotB
MNRHVLAGTVALGLAFPLGALAQGNPELEELKAQVAALQQKIQEMEAREAAKATAAPAPGPADAKAATAATTAQAPNWSERISVNGDFRYRFDGTDEESREYSGRQSLRARLIVDGRINDTTNVVMQLGTGGANPRSQEATLSGDGGAKEITLRQAYVNWKPIKGVTVTAGKMPTPWVLNPVDYYHDSDYYPEGIAVKYGAASGFHAAGFWTQIAERGSFSDESSMLGAQVGYSNDLFFANVAYQDFQRMKGYNPCFAGSNCNGNTLVGGLLANDYNLVQVRGGLKLSGVTIFGSWDQNLEADDEDTAYSFGITYGKVKDPGSWSVGALYQDVERDALYGGMLDGTFAGGRTAHDGYVLSGAYGFAKNWSGSLLWFINEVDQAGTPHDYDRFQLDLLWKF